MKDIYMSSREELHAWLELHHVDGAGVRLVFDKGTTRTLPYDAIVEELLCFGRIDSKPGRVDAQRSKLRIAPRNPKSNRSKINKERVETLIREGRMQAAGIRMVEKAKQEWTRDALNGVENLLIPGDLQQAFKHYSHAQSNFEAFPKSVKRGILERILNAKKPETRAARIEETARLAQENVRANQRRK